MVHAQIDIDEHEDRNLRIYMAFNNITSKPDAIKSILAEYFLIRPPRMEVDNVRKTIENQPAEDILR